MTHFILCGHGSYGSSLLESMEMLLPEVDHVSAIDFKVGHDSSDLTDMINSTLAELDDKPVLIICDIVGGAPFKISAIETINRNNTGIIAGLNLASILEITFMRDLPLKELIETAVDTARQSIEYIEH